MNSLRRKYCPILIDKETKIFSREDHKKYFDYWNTKYEDIVNEIKERKLNNETTDDLDEDEKHYQNIRVNIRKILAHITQIKIPYFDKLKSEDYKPLLDFIGISQEGDIRSIFLHLVNLTNIDNEEEQDIAIETITKKYPYNEMIYLAKGEIYLKRNHFKRAIKAYKEAIEINPESDMAYNNMGVVYEKQGENEKAIECYKKALETNPKKDETCYNMGVVYRKQKNYDQAITYYKKALKINPQNDLALSSMGVAYGKKGKNKKAIEYCEKALKINPQNEVALSIMGIIYDKKGKNKKAIEYCEKALAIAKKNNSLNIEEFEKNLQMAKKKQ